MNADELQRWSSNLRWIGLSVTALGALITFGSHVIADKLLVVQRDEKAKAQERQRVAEAQIAAAQDQAEQANRLAAELKLSQQPRVLPEDLIQKITAAAMQSSAKADLQISWVAGDPEAWALAEQLKSAFVAGGFDLGRIVPVIRTPPIIGLTVSARDISPSPLHTCVVALMRHFGMPLNVNQARPEDKPWNIAIGKKP